jgi:hypothetical protein
MSLAQGGRQAWGVVRAQRRGLAWRLVLARVQVRVQWGRRRLCVWELQRERQSGGESASKREERPGG